ncbi:DUF2064 domain-containing protein [Microcella sp.]|uniref:TIGR04282 family arsenosugar biosynthesis glycosyltransferase n=1 Tax=Microcella sp. TaxID=1913979 RepID=UPI00391DB8D4
MTTIIVMAKECRPGSVKTRLCPPYTPVQAALIAEASLRDTLDTLASTLATRRVLCLDGVVDFDTSGWETVAQRLGTLDERIAEAIDSCTGPTIVVGMDTPQISAAHIREPLQHWPTGVDAFFGPATDGGYWLLGLRQPDGDLVRGVPMSQPDTGALQRSRLLEAGLVTRDLVTLTDIDTAESLHAVRSQLTEGRLSHVLDELGASIHANS